jgi:hypothetical protein
VRSAALAAAVVVLACGIEVQGGLAQPVRAAGGLPTLRTHPLISQPGPQGAPNSQGPSNTSIANQWSSDNWSGYYVTSSQVMMGEVLDVAGCWTVPSVPTNAGNTFSSAWIGIDGVTNEDLIQTGTEQAYYDGSLYYLPWWEILPATQTTITAFTIAPGDLICASITAGYEFDYTITIQDVTTGGQYSTVQEYTGPRQTAEWIMERPEICENPPSCTDTELSTLADYGQTTFDPVSVNGANPELVAADGGDMCDSSETCTGAPVISTPSNPDADGNGFTVAYGSVQPPPPSAGTAYTALQPYRICDTRSVATTGYTTECSGSPLPQGPNLVVPITGVAGPSGQSVPPDAESVVLNVTAIGGTAATYLTVFPLGVGSRPNASNLNVTADVNQANLVVVALGVDGDVGIYNAAGTINVAVDVEGYFAPASVSSSVPGLFHPIAPLRICDTRSTAVTGYSTACSGDSLGQNQWEKVVVSGCPTGDPSCTESVPTSDAASVALNLTGVNGTASTYLSVVPPTASDLCPTTAPGFSNLNIAAGTALPNRVIVPLGPDQDVCVYNSAGTINFILDVNGWFGSGSESSPGAYFYATAPTRVCDTRPIAVTGYSTECTGQTLGQSGTLTIPVAGVDELPPAGGSSPPLALIANVTAVSGTASTYFTLYPSNVTQPTASDLNVGPGQNTPNLVIVQLATTGGQAGAVNLYNAAGSINAIVDVAGWFQ